MDVKNVLNQYLGMVPISSIIWESPGTGESGIDKVTFSCEDQSLIFQEVCCHHINKIYPPSGKYQKGFLKYIIFQAEDRGHEVINEIYILFTSLLSCGPSENSEYCYKSYSMGQEYVTMKESVNMISCGTTGLITWQASVAFIEWAISSEAVNNFTGRCVLELGCGIGFAGISLCRLCRLGGYIFTDCHETVLERLGENMDVNLKGCSTETKVKLLDWTVKEEVEKLLAEIGGPVDYLVATDVIYDCDIIGPLLAAMEIILQFNASMTIYISSTIRNKDTYKHFTDCLVEKNFKWTRMENGCRLPFLYYDRTLPIEILEITSPG